MAAAKHPELVDGLALTSPPTPSGPAYGQLRGPNAYARSHHPTSAPSSATATAQC
jgi:pimeloyl-ACP methyl ester carboxylesterase